jgi:hypothetical protein
VIHKKRLEYKRYFRNIRSKLKKRLRNGAKLSHRVKLKYHLVNKESYYYYVGKYSNRERDFLDIKIPKIFSVTDAPDDTLRFLDQLGKKLKEKIPYDLHISHEITEKIGLSASFLFDRTINAYIQKWRKYRVGIRLSGKVSSVREVNNFLLSFGLLDELQIHNHNLFPEKADIDYSTKYITYKKIGSSEKTYEAGNASTEIVEYFNKCFVENGFRIRNTPRYKLVDCYGEIIKNAEEHSGVDKTVWYVLGCYNKDNHVCSFSVINYGLSFYETLANPNSTAKEVLDQITDIIFSHYNFWKKIGQNKTIFDGMIWTMMALQDGISSKRSESGKSSTRGQGIMDVIEFIDNIRNKDRENKLSVVSGDAMVEIDYTYPLIKKEYIKSKEKRRIMTFNKEGELSIPPDEKYIRQIPYKFPGTIFSGHFVIDRNYLVDLLGGKNGK